MVRAKFKVTDIVPSENGGNIKLSVVVGDGEENKKFFYFTPFGEINIGTVNIEALKEFEIGKEYYVDFTKAE